MAPLRLYLFLLLAALLGAGCAGGGSPAAPSALRENATPCLEVYAYAPGSYIINIAGGDEVVLDPAVRDFNLFCTAESAEEGLNNALDEGKAPPGDWRIFRVYGDMARIGVEVEPGAYLLIRPAPLVDWVE